MAITYSPWRRRARLAYAWARSNPVWCAWQVTYRCNFKCSFCHYWKEDSVDELTPEQFEHCSRRLAVMGSLMVSLAGGEPLLREDLPEIVAAVARYHFPFMTTNGWMVKRALARELFNRGLWGASVSIDYADPDRHDEQRGVKGSFERAVQALKIFSEERTRPHQRVNLMAVLTHDNLDDMGELVRLAKKCGAHFMVQPFCFRKINDRSFSPSPDVSEKLLRLRRTYDNFISNPCFLEQFDAALNGGVKGCRAGKSFFNIDESGNVAKCVEDRRNPVGNLFTDPIRSISNALRKRHRENTCSDCWYNCRGEVEMLYTARGALNALPAFLSNSSDAKRQIASRALSQ